MEPIYEYLISRNNKKNVSILPKYNTIGIDDFFKLPMPFDPKKASIYNVYMSSAKRQYSENKVFEKLTLGFNKKENILVDLHRTKRGNSQFFVIDKKILNEEQVFPIDIEKYMIAFPLPGAWLVGPSILNPFLADIMNMFLYQYKIGTISAK